MIFTRPDLETREDEFLATYAVRSRDATRQFPDREDESRTAFSRDRARIIHSKSFRRLRGKTQVFVAHHGDHFRNRLVHTLEVAQISRDTARNLRLNEDLAESIALAHDLGHTPFGHVGEAKLDELLRPHGLSFEHNQQSRRILTTLEKKYPDFDGLNLTNELLDGLEKHRSPYDSPENSSPRQPSLEAQLVNLADEIAYTAHDLDDGLRAGILTRDSLESLKLWRSAVGAADASLPLEAWNHRVASAVISLLVRDLLATTEANLKKAGVESPEAVKKFPRSLVGFSPEISEQLDEAHRFLFQNFYRSSEVETLSRDGAEKIEKIFTAVLANHDLLPAEFQKRLAADEPVRVTADFVAGMTDDFATEFAKKI